MAMLYHKENENGTRRGGHLRVELARAPQFPLDLLWLYRRTCRPATPIYQTRKTRKANKLRLCPCNLIIGGAIGALADALAHCERTHHACCDGVANLVADMVVDASACPAFRRRTWGGCRVCIRKSQPKPLRSTAQPLARPVFSYSTASHRIASHRIASHRKEGLAGVAAVAVVQVSTCRRDLNA